MSEENDAALASTCQERALSYTDRKVLLQAQVTRLLASETFRGAHTASRLLDYIVTRSLDGRPDELKESTIGVEVFHKRPDFDPKVDTIVRVQIYRLRQKLARYYEAEGQRDTLRISIPRGSYYAEFSMVELPAAVTESTSGPVPEVEACALETPAGIGRDETQAGDAIEPRRDLRPHSLRLGGLSKWIRSAIIFLVLACAGAMGGYLFALRNESVPAHNTKDPVERLWLSMLAGDSAPIIGYPDPVYLIDDSNDMFGFGSGAVGFRGAQVDPHVAQQFATNHELVSRAGALYYENGYTGTGDLESVAMLVGLLHDLGLHPVVKRGHNITAADLRDHNLILLGSEFEDKTKRALPSGGDFQFVAAGPEAWSLRIANLHPSPNEARFYGTARDPVTKSVTEDYALISFQPSIVPTRHIVVLGGLDTTGTVGATSFSISTNGAQQLLNLTNSPKRDNHRNPFFQAVVQCEIQNGDDVSSVKAVAIHATPWESH